MINGIAAGYVTHRLGPGVPRPDFHIFAPEGVAGMLLVGLSTAWVGYLGSGPPPAST